MWRDKKIVVAVSGGIAAYKACSLVSSLTKEGAKVRVAMTESATSFVSPECFAALSGEPVLTGLFERVHEIPHIRLGQESDLIVVAPATANILAKLALGIGDDLVSSILLAASAPIAVIPAMNSIMWANPAVQANVASLRARGIRVVDPESGNLACNTQGPGRFPPLELIMDELTAVLTTQNLAGRKILITAGPTREYIDPVRFLSNPSSGLMGLALSRAAWFRGAEVTLILGPTSLQVPRYIRVLPVTSARQMHEAVVKEFPAADVLFMSAAVADYRPAQEAAEKLKKRRGELNSLPLERNPDILVEVKKMRNRNQVVIGFAAESGQGLGEAGREKLVEKGLDYIVANSVYKDREGFGRPRQSHVLVLGNDGSQTDFSDISKADLAAHLCELVSQHTEAG